MVDGARLVMPVWTTEAALDCDPPWGYTQKGLAKPYHLAHHVFDALAAPTAATLPDGRRFADFSRIQGRLAESFETRDGDSRWIVTLRQGVRSHAGHELTAEDVVWSYQRVFAFRAVGMWRASTIAGVAREGGVRALDRRRVEFRIDGHNPHLPRFLCYATAAIVDAAEAQRHATEDDPWAAAHLADNSCGFGGFTMTHRDGERLELVPRPDFWAGAPPVDGVSYLTAPSRAEAIALFEGGEANVVAGLYPDEAERLRAAGDVRLLLSRTNHATIEMDRSRPPFDDRRAREAVLRAVPYDRIVREAYGGYAERQRGIYQPNTPAFTEAGWDHEQDAGRASRLLDEAGAVGAEVTFGIPGSDDPGDIASGESRRIGAIVAAALGAIGLRVRVRHISDLGDGETPGLYLRGDCSHGIADRQYDLGIDFAPPHDMPGRLFPTPRVSARLRAIRHAASAEQPALYEALQRELVADAACVPLAGHTYVVAYREGLHPWFLTPEYLPLHCFLWSHARYVIRPLAF